MTRKHIILACLLGMSFIDSHAQITSGFYRVQNYGSKRYAYVCDNTGSIVISNTSADMGAIALYNPTARDRFSDPASVLYAKKTGTSGSYTMFDLQSQNTGVYDIINHYVSILKGDVSGTYSVYEPKYKMYLWDQLQLSGYYKQSYIGSNPLTDDSGKMLTNYRCWNVIPVDANSDEYLGIAPNPAIKKGDKYYKTYTLGFPISFASTGMKAYYVSEVKSDAVIIKEIVGTIPAMTPVIVECSSTESSNNRVNLLTTTVSAISGNKLSSNLFCYEDHGTTAYRVYNPSTMRVLAVKDGQLQFITDTQDEYTTKLKFQNGYDITYKQCLNANEAYLIVAAGSAADLPVMTEEEYKTSHQTKKGDVNNDGLINSTDVAVVYQLIRDGAKAAQHTDADVNGDGLINSTDVAVIYQLIREGAK